MTKNHPPFFSVIINNFNYGRYLKQAIDSVLRQTFSDYELIVVDDASTDMSLDVLKLYEGRLTLIEMPGNKGQTATFNEGVAHARGEYVCLLDADDVFLDHKLEKLYEVIQAAPNHDLYQHQYYYTDEALQICSSILPNTMRSGDLSGLFLKYGLWTYSPTSAYCYKASFLKTILPIDLPLTSTSGDHPLMMLTHLLGTIYSVPQPLMLYRLHGKNSSLITKQTEYLNSKALFKSRLVMEKIYLCVNDILEKKGLSMRVDIQKSITFQRHCYAFGEFNFWRLCYAVLTTPVISRFKEKILFLNTARQWRKCIEG